MSFLLERKTKQKQKNIKEKVNRMANDQNRKQ